MIIDRATFDQQYGDFDKEILIDILDTFLNDCPSRMAEIDKSIREKNHKSLEFSAHKLKGAISVFTITKPYEISQEIVDKARKKDGSGLDKLYVELKTNVEELVNEIKEIRESYT